MTNLTIFSKEIRTLEGLYSLNDLHKASGGQSKHRPTYWVKNSQTQELVDEISSKDGIPSLRIINAIKGGNMRGTWVCKELVYSYAMWINAKFHLQVIRAFDAMVQNDLFISSPDSVTLSNDQARFLACTFRMIDKLEVRYHSTRKNIQSLQTQVNVMRSLCDNIDTEIKNLQSQISGDFDVINHIHLYKNMSMDYQDVGGFKRFMEQMK